MGHSTGQQVWTVGGVARRAQSEQEMLNEQGKDGWELVSVLPGPEGSTTYYLKQPEA